MKDGKYEVGDVIAFRVTATNAVTPKGGYYMPTNKLEKFCIYAPSTGMYEHSASLERIPNPKLMEGEWWKGWTLRFIAEGETAPSGALFFTGCCGRDESKWSANWCRGYSLVPDPPCGKYDRYALIPPPPDPKPLCPELREKIERVEAELARLKKQALG